jgi:hypothetical protein
MSNLSTVDLKISEIIDILMLHPEAAVPPEYQELGEHLARFKLQNSADPLELMRSMISTFEINREVEEDYEFIDESGGEPEETSGAYSDDESFFNEFSLLSAVEHRVFLGLVMKISKKVEGFVEFLTTMQDTLIRLEFSTPQVMEVMSEHLNPNCSRFYSTGIKSMLEQAFSVNYEYN